MYSPTREITVKCGFPFFVILIIIQKEIMKNYSIYGLSVKDELNPELIKFGKVKPNIAKALIRIADEFHNMIDIAPEIEDVRLVGSSVNYNWTKQSDIDLHLVYDFSKFTPCPDAEFIRDFLNLKKNQFNDRYDLKIHDYQVEVYCEDINDVIKSTAIYSLISDTWVKRPKKQKIQADRDRIKSIADEYAKSIERLPQIRDPHKRYEYGMEIKDQLISLRKRGLERSGEFNDQNIAYKSLRAAGFISTLYDEIITTYNQILSFPLEEEDDENI